MGKIVKNGGNGKEIELGKGNEMATCELAEPWGWGSSCRSLVLKRDGYYHCDDCGLTFTTNLKIVGGPNTSKCKCYQLVNSIKWELNDFFGYECPTSQHRCVKCGRVYELTHSVVAPEDKQGSEAARAYARWVHGCFKRHKEEKVDKAEQMIAQLNQIFRKLPSSDVKALKKKLLAKLS